MSDLKYKYNDNAVCPYCDAEQSDSWEINCDDGETVQTECDTCEKTILFTLHVTVQYSTDTAPCMNGESEHQWRQRVGAPKEYFVGKQVCDRCFAERTVEASNA